MRKGACILLLASLPLVWERSQATQATGNAMQQPAASSSIQASEQEEAPDGEYNMWPGSQRICFEVTSVLNSDDERWKRAWDPLPAFFFLFLLEYSLFLFWKNIHNGYHLFVAFLSEGLFHFCLIYYGLLFPFKNGLFPNFFLVRVGESFWNKEGCGSYN